MHINDALGFLLLGDAKKAETLPNIMPRTASSFHFDAKPRQRNEQEEGVNDIVEGEEQEANHGAGW